MGEVSYLKLKLADMEGKQGQGAERQHKAEVGVLIQPPICCGQKGFICNSRCVDVLSVRTCLKLICIHQNKVALLT